MAALMSPSKSSTGIQSDKITRQTIAMLDAWRPLFTEAADDVEMLVGYIRTIAGPEQ